MRHAVVMSEIAIERFHVFGWASLLQTNLIVTARIVHQCINPAELSDCFGDGLLACLCCTEIDGDQSTLATTPPDFGLQFLARFRITAHNYRNGPFFGTGAHNGSPNAFSSACNNDHFVLQPKIHALVSQVEEPAIERIIRASNK